MHKDFDKEELGKFIRKLRTSHNMTQKELAAKIFYTDKSVSKWETGEGFPKYATVKKLSEIFGVSMNDFLGEETIEENFSNSDIDKNIGLRKLKIIFILIFLFLFVCISVLMEDRNRVYRINYEDENFSMSNGTLDLGSDSHIDFGKFKIDLMKNEDKRLHFILFLLDNDKETELINFTEPTDTWYLSGKSKALLKNSLNDNKIDNLYLKVFYYNEIDEEISYKIHLTVFQKEKSFSEPVSFNLNRYNEILTINDKFSMIRTFSKQSDEIDLNFLFNMDSQLLKECFENKRVNLKNGLNYEINYIQDLSADDNYITIFDNNNFMQIFMNYKRIVIYDVITFHYIVESNNVIKRNEVSKYFNLIKDFSDKLKILYNTCKKIQ